MNDRLTIAAMAMQGMLADGRCNSGPVAADALRFADALLAKAGDHGDGDLLASATRQLAAALDEVEMLNKERGILREAWDQWTATDPLNPSDASDAELARAHKTLCFYLGGEM